MATTDHTDDVPHPRPDDARPIGPPRSDARPAGAGEPTLLDHMGGRAGLVYSTVPVVVFVAANAFLPLPMTIVISLATGLVLFGFRLLRGQRFSMAIGSLLGVGLAAALVALTGSARDFFAIGIWVSLAAALVTLGSVLWRRPITGVVWNLVHGGTHDWRADRPSLRAHDLATLATTLVAGARFAVQQWLYVADSTTWLGIARVVMGIPLTVVSALVVVWAFRRSTRRLIKPGR